MHTHRLALKFSVRMPGDALMQKRMSARGIRINVKLQKCAFLSSGFFIFLFFLFFLERSDFTDMRLIFFLLPSVVKKKVLIVKKYFPHNSINSSC